MLISMMFSTHAHTCWLLITGTAAAMSSCLNLNVFSVPSASKYLHTKAQYSNTIHTYRCDDHYQLNVYLYKLDHNLACVDSQDSCFMCIFSSPWFLLKEQLTPCSLLGGLEGLGLTPLKVTLQLLIAHILFNTHPRTYKFINSAITINGPFLRKKQNYKL